MLSLPDVEKRIAAAQASGKLNILDYGRAGKQGLVENIDPAEPYLEQIDKLVNLKGIIDAGLRVVVDPMWGVGQGWFSQLLSGGKTQVKEIHDERNPLFP